jgi:hypothetical protein
MKKTSKTETVLELGDADNGITIAADHRPGEVPTEVAIHLGGAMRIISIEALLRAAHAVKVVGWGYPVCADHGRYNGDWCGGCEKGRLREVAT